MNNIWIANKTSIDRSVVILDEGALVAIPTETVYGLAADAQNGPAVALVYETKGRPQFNPLIVHVASLEQAKTIAHFDHCAERLAAHFWPGALTLVLPLKKDAPIAALVTAGLQTVAIRMPAHPIAQAVLAALGRSFVAPSANLSGGISPTSAAHVMNDFGTDVMVLDGGPCTMGLESTIISLIRSRPTLLRPGAIASREIEAVLSHPLHKADDKIIAPGMLKSHYAPSNCLRINAENAAPEEVLLGFGGTNGAALDLSLSGNLREAAANLFAYLRQLDEMAKPIAVAPIPLSGLGVAINDRLRRASAPRGE